jgi:hypothetical protein
MTDNTVKAQNGSDCGASNRGTFCVFCNSFKIRLSSFTSSFFAEKRMYQLGSYGDVSARTNCPLCQLISNAFASGPVPTKVSTGQLGGLNSSRIQAAWLPTVSDSDPLSSLTIWLIPPDEDFKIRLHVRPLVEADSPSQPYFARKVDGNSLTSFY